MHKLMMQSCMHIYKYADVYLYVKKREKVQYLIINLQNCYYRRNCYYRKNRIQSGVLSHDNALEVKK